MVSRPNAERELERCIDKVVDEVVAYIRRRSQRGGKNRLKMSDIRLRDELICQIKEEIRCKRDMRANDGRTDDGD